MPAHKLNAYIDAPHKRIVFCDVCGQEEPTGDCIGSYQLSEKEQKWIDDCFNADMLKIFGVGR